MSFNKIIKSLVDSDMYFKERNDIEVWRAIGINDYSFRYDDSEHFKRANIWYWSNQFEEMISNLDIKNNDIEILFYKNKDKLNDLSWIVTGYN